MAEAWRDAGLLSRHFLGGTEENHAKSHRDRRSPNRYAKPEPLEHKVAHTGKLQGMAKTIKLEI